MGMKPFLIFVLLAGSVCILAQDPQDLLVQGNNSYLEGNYEEAINSYETVLDSGYEAAELYYNLGNAYFKSHKITSALLFYERAHLLAPNDEDINYNLELAKTFVVDKIDVLPQFFLTQWHVKMVRLLNSDSWAVISIIGFILFLCLFSLYLFLNVYWIKKLSFWFGIIALFVAVSAFLFSYHHKKITYAHDNAIIFSPAVTVKSSPDDSGTDLFLIHEGTKVHVEDTLGNWSEIKLADGNKGWLPSITIVKI